MAAFNVSLDDSSPLISYSPSGAWADSPANDTRVQSYSSNSLHTTSKQGATATFSFNGTGIWLFGGKRSNYGAYSVSVDGNVVKNGTASSSSFEGNQLLGGAANLTMGQHTAVLSSTSSNPIDLDSVVFETQVSGANGTVNSSLIMDRDPKVQYSPANAWVQSNNTLFSNGTATYTATTGAQASLTFNGDAVAVYGGSSFDHGDYEVLVDGHSQRYNGGGDNGLARIYHAQTLLFFANNLGSQQHNLTIISHGTNTTKFLDLDSVAVYQASNGSDAGSGGMALPNGTIPKVNQADNNASGATSSSLSKGAITGIIIASVVGSLLIIALIIFLVVRHRQKQLKKKMKKRGSSAPSPILPIQDPDLEAQKVDYFTEKPADIPAYDTNVQFPREFPQEKPDAYGTQGYSNQGYLSQTQAQMPVPEPAPLDAYYNKPELSFPEPPPFDPYYNEPGRPSLERSHTKQTTYTTNTRWSQASFDSTSATLTGSETPKIPPVPAPHLASRNSLDSVSSFGDSDSDSDSPSRRNSDTDDFASYYRSSIPEPRNSGPPPSRPPRPPGLELNYHGRGFDTVPL